MGVGTAGVPTGAYQHTRLTDLTIRGAKPGERLVKLSDGEGLQLHVHPNGSRLWRLAYRFDGKQKILAMGKYPEVGLKEARNRKAKVRAKLADGVDPVAERNRKTVRGTT